MRIERAVRPGLTFLHLLALVGAVPLRVAEHPGPTKCPPARPGAKRPIAIQTAKKRQAVVELVGMQRWLRLTVRKHAVGKVTTNPAADAAADALAKMLGESKTPG